MNYTFTESFKGFFNSLYFIFFVRPYEIGDLIFVFDKYYEVHEINLVSTILYDGSIYSICPNSKLSGENIKNLRLNKTLEENLTYRFLFSDFETKSEEFLKKLRDSIKKKSSEFRKRPYFNKVTMVNKTKAEVVLTVLFNTSAVDIEKLTERRNALVFKLNSLFNEIGMIPTNE